MSYSQLAESVDRLNDINLELVESVLAYQNAVQLPDYDALDKYRGNAKRLCIAHKEYTGVFYAEPEDTTTVPDGGITRRDGLGRLWRRAFLGRVQVRWFTKPSSTLDATQAFNAASAAASVIANGMAGDVSVTAGNWLLSAPVTPAANWYLDGAATIMGRPVVGSEVLPIHDTTYLTGQLFDFRAGTGAQVRIGDPRPWLTEWAPISECISTLTVLNPKGRPAGIFGTRTSDRPDTGALSYALRASVVNDDIVNVKGGWSVYIETYRAAGAGNTFGMETDFLNLGNTANLDPFSNLTGGLTCNLWMGSGGGSTPLAPQANSLSACMALLPNSKGFNRGIVFRENSITGSDKDAIALPKDYRFAWFESAGVTRSFLDYKLHRMTVSSDDISECPTRLSRKWGANNTATLINSTLHRDEQQNFNGASSVLAAYTETSQRGNITPGSFSRVSWTTAARCADGTFASWSLNRIIDNTFGPDNDAGSSLARANQRINNSYFAVAPTVTSDERDKVLVQGIDDTVLDAWSTVEFVKYKLVEAVNAKGEADARWHFGLIAQKIKEAFESKGLNAFDFGLLCHDSWEAQAATYSEDGEEITAAMEAGDRYGVRYEEALALEAALMRRTTRRLEQRIAALENK